MKILTKKTTCIALIVALAFTSFAFILSSNIDAAASKPGKVTGLKLDCAYYDSHNKTASCRVIYNKAKNATKWQVKMSGDVKTKTYECYRTGLTFSSPTSKKKGKITVKVRAGNKAGWSPWSDAKTIKYK